MLSSLCVDKIVFHFKVRETSLILVKRQQCDEMSNLEVLKLLPNDMQFLRVNLHLHYMLSGVLRSFIIVNKSIALDSSYLCSQKVAPGATKGSFKIPDYGRQIARIAYQYHVILLQCEYSPSVATSHRKTYVFPMESFIGAPLMSHVTNRLKPTLNSFEYFRLTRHIMLLLTDFKSVMCVRAIWNLKKPLEIYRCQK